MLKVAIICGVAAISAAGAAGGVLSLQHGRDQTPAEAVATTTETSTIAAVARPEPVPVASTGSRDASIPKSADGHFWAEGQVNGSAMRFLVDTGATAISLTPDDARRLGFQPDTLTYGYKVITAAGEARAAKIQLNTVSIGGARVDGVDAYVIEKGLSQSLLGMSYLGRLNRFEATQSALILRS